MDLNEMVVFARVVEAGSFTAAARALAMPKSTVSRKVSDLEERLGARLLQRTTRKLSLTDVGHTYYQYARRVVDEVEEAEAAVTRMQEQPRGLLRVTMPLNFRYLGPAVASFLRRYPEVQVEMTGADRTVDLVAEGFDVALRVGPLADSTLIARPLGVLSSVVVASPEFVARNGAPQAPEDLSRIDCVAFGGVAEPTVWRLEAGGKVAAPTVRARLIVNDFDLVEDAVVGGLGVGLLPVFRAVDYMRAGRLVRLLSAWRSPDRPIHAVYPSARHLSRKVSAFLDHLRETLVPAPWELAPPP